MNRDWVELKEGCEMPEADETVIWWTKDGWAYTGQYDNEDFTGFDHYLLTCTHWKRIIGPGEEPDQDVLWDELFETIKTGTPFPINRFAWIKKHYTLIPK